MIKKLRYNDYDFEIRVAFNVEVEKQLNGKRYHRLDVICKQTIFSFELKFEDAELESAIKQAQARCMAYSLADNPDKTTMQLLQLGFEYES